MQDPRGGLGSDRAMFADHHRAEATNGSAASGRRALVRAAALALLLPAVSLAAVTPEQKCEGGKNSAAGKYDACAAKAEKGLVTKGDMTRYADALVKCEEKLVKSWDKLEAKAVAAGAACPSTGDQVAIQNFVDACVQSVAVAVGGGTLAPDPVTCNTNLGTCNSDLSTANADLMSCTGDLATANAGTAAVGDVLSGKTFTSTAGVGATGTMANNGAVTLTPMTSDQAIAAGYHNGSGKCAGDTDLVAGNVKNGVNLFGVTGTASAGGLQETGQTICYNTAGSVIACAGTGQDGELQKGVTNSFTDNGDGTVTDNLTGLMWEKLSDDGTIHDKDNTYTWADAFASKVATLNSSVFAGFSDWRVPNRKELDTLVNLEAVNPSTFSAFNTSCSAACTVLTCSCTRSDYHWSSTTVEALPYDAWVVNFFLGETFNNFKSTTYFVRAVRAGS